MPITPPKTTATDRRVLGVALSIGIAGILMTAVPAIDFRIKQSFAERLGRHAEAAPPAAARVETRELAKRGVIAIPTLVQLAGSFNPDAADAARDEVAAALESWESEYRTSMNAARLGQKLTILAEALARWTPTYEIVGRLWADRLALQIAEDTAVLTATDAAKLLAHCDHVLAVAPAQPRPAPPAIAAAELAPDVPTDPPSPIESVNDGSSRAATIVSGQNTAETLVEQTPSPAPSTMAPETDLRLVDEAPVAPLVETPLPTVVTAPPASDPLEPRIATEEPQQSVLPLPAPKPEVVDVPPPQQVRPMLRTLRLQSDSQLVHELATSSGYRARLIQQVLRERNLPTAVGPTASISPSQKSDVERRLLEQVSRLSPAQGRQLLRDLVADIEEDPEVRLQALTLLATSGDPQLASIARERAIEDADPRVADLATRIVREQSGGKK